MASWKGFVAALTVVLMSASRPNVTTVRGDPVTGLLFNQLKEMDNKVSSAEKLFDLPASSERSCARICSHPSSSCAAFTFAQGSCFGYSLPPSPSSASSVASASTFLCPEKVDWLNAACSSNIDCTSLYSGAICNANKCVCDGGLYYSQSSHACQSSCSNLLESYVFYEGYDMWEHDNKHAPRAMAAANATNPVECYAECNRIGSSCPMFVMIVPASECFFKLDAPGDLDPHSAGDFHTRIDRYAFIRECQQ